MKRVLLGLGSNRAFENKTPLEILSCAQSELAHYLDNLSFSSVYRTPAMYVEDQEDFYNMTALGYVPDDLDAFDLLKIINQIEAQYGRDRSREIRFGPRSLDIDIELFGDLEINHPDLQIPHPRMQERAFVLIPAIEILTNPADEIVREKYISCLKKVTAEGGADGIVKVGGYRNGNGTDNCSDKACL